MPDVEFSMLSANNLERFSLDIGDECRKGEAMVIGLSDTEMADTQAWLSELESPSTEARAQTLVLQLSTLLRGYMGVDDELLRFAFWSHYQRKQDRGES